VTKRCSQSCSRYSIRGANYPLDKEGKVNAAKMRAKAEAMQAEANRLRPIKDAEKAEEEHRRQVVKCLRETFGLSWGVLTYPDSGIGVALTNLSEDQARMVMTFAKDHGLLPSDSIQPIR
jgi:hypothetical protein